jgi:hypothetical protein
MYVIEMSDPVLAEIKLGAIVGVPAEAVRAYLTPVMPVLHSDGSPTSESVNIFDIETGADCKNTAPDESCAKLAPLR